MNFQSRKNQEGGELIIYPNNHINIISAIIYYVIRREPS